MNYIFPARYFQENLDYAVDLTDLLIGNDTIETTTVTCSSLTVSKKSNTTKVVYFWLSGGVSKMISIIDVVATTTNGRTIEVQIKINTI
jgi:hypothetical protein